MECSDHEFELQLSFTIDFFFVKCSVIITTYEVMSCNYFSWMSSMTVRDPDVHIQLSRVIVPRYEKKTNNSFHLSLEFCVFYSFIRE